MKNQKNFLLGESTESKLFTVSKDESSTKEGTGKMHCMHSGMVKGTSRAEAMLNSKKN